MDTILKPKEDYIKLETILKKHEIKILEYSTEELDSYITLEYKKDKSILNQLLLIREKEYVLTFEKKDNLLKLTISGNSKIYKDLIETLNQEQQINLKDIETIINFIEKIDKEVTITSYFNGITYFYSITPNKYDTALKYYNFSFDGYRYHYQINNYESFNQIIKNINKDIEVYKDLMKDTDVITKENITDKNTNIQEIREIYSKKGSKELAIIFKNSLYYIAIKLNNELYLYQYNNELKIKNIIPDLLNIYLEKSGSSYKEDRYSCLGKSFYMNILNSDNKLFIYNVDDEDIDYYIQYIKVITKNPIKSNEYNQNITPKIENKTNKSSGFADILLLSTTVLIFSIIVFLITLNILKNM